MFPNDTQNRDEYIGLEKCLISKPLLFEIVSAGLFNVYRWLCQKVFKLCICIHIAPIRKTLPTQHDKPNEFVTILFALVTPIDDGPLLSFSY